MEEEEELASSSIHSTPRPGQEQEIVRLRRPRREAVEAGPPAGSGSSTQSRPVFPLNDGEVLGRFASRLAHHEKLKG